MRVLFRALTLLHSEWPKLYGVLAILGAIGLSEVVTAKIPVISNIKVISVCNRSWHRAPSYFAIGKLAFEETHVPSCLVSYRGSGLNYSLGVNETQSPSSYFKVIILKLVTQVQHV